MRYVIVGGVAGGATAATRLRRLDEQAEIIVFERSNFVSYANCGLPYYVGGVITDQEELTLQTPASLWQRYRIDVRVQQEVIHVNVQKKSVSVRNHVTGEVYEELYDKLLLSPGARAVRPNMQGMDSDKIFTLRTVEDTYRIHDYVVHKRPKSVVIVGGGFIGLEMAENFREHRLNVTIVQQLNQVMNVLDFDMAMLLHGELRRQGVELRLCAVVTGFEDKGDHIDVRLQDGSILQADMVLMAIGVVPDSALAQSAGLQLGLKDSIKVSENMATSAPNIYAAGDVVQVSNIMTGEDVLIALAGPANKQGRIAADNMAGGNSSYKGSIGSSILKLFDLTVACTGLSEAAAQKAGYECECVVLSPASHAGYYPGAMAMTMKVVFEKKTYRLLGAQIVGYAGVDKRIDVLATAIHFGSTAIELKDLELAYAPPYSSAKDPVNMSGFIVDNIATGKVRQFHWQQVEALRANPQNIMLDTRTVSEYKRGHVEGFVNIPLDELRERLDELDKRKTIYVMCHSGLRSYLATRILMQRGYSCYNFSGGYSFYSAVTQEKALLEKIHPCGLTH